MEDWQWLQVSVVTPPNAVSLLLIALPPFLPILLNKLSSATISSLTLINVFASFLFFLLSHHRQFQFFDEEEPISLGQAIQDLWMKRKSQVEHEYAVTRLALSVLPEVCVNVASELLGEYQLMIEKIVNSQTITCFPRPNDKVSDYSMTIIIDIFWHEFKHLQNMIGPYAVCQ